MESREPTTVEAAARSSSEPQSEVKARLKLTKLSDADAYFTAHDASVQDTQGALNANMHRNSLEGHNRPCQLQMQESMIT